VVTVTETVVVAPMLVALSTAIATLLARGRERLTAWTSVIGGVAYVVAVAALVTRVLPGLLAGGVDPQVLTYQLSGWAAPYGITLVADALSTFMLALSAAVVLPALVFAVRYVDEYGQRLAFHPVYHLMLVGVTGSFLTGDLFNLFVWFEVMLMASYVLVVFYGGPEHTRAALRYVVLNLVGGAFMLVAVGGIYATVGTLNMADVGRRLAAPEAYGVDPAPVLGVAAVLFAVFALKAGVVPFQFWVPSAYRAAPAPVSAVLAGVVKKVGIYAMIRLYFTVFAGGAVEGGLRLPGLAGEPFLGFFGPVLLVMAAASILLGGVGAVGRDDLDELLAYSSIGQVGFIVLPLAVGATVADPAVRRLAIAAALVYALNHALAKSLLFLVSGAVFDAVGSIDLRDLGGVARTDVTLSASFFVGMLALVGIPPLSGFFGKLLVFDVAVRAGSNVVLAVGLAGAVLTIGYTSLAWNRGFWGEVGDRVGTGSPSPVLLGVVAALALAVIAVGVGFDPVFRAAEAAAEAALDRAAYVDAVCPAPNQGGCQ
jgi:multicomponent Na+:H+ antiporter subunit D